ncbi:MAG: hypothetical protein GTO63_33900 [Anaerolineae bacterium]|nr:hypothetical protein [Anaerolineae bacterium]NIN99627.1 hypothetical protein [Anaerolineae bacterium]
MSLEAESLLAEVTEMRTALSCLSETEMEGQPWESFTPEKTFEFTSTQSSSVGFYVAVQYRDTLSNLSPVYCDDTSIEGSGAVTTTP